ncbi:hypothetical protein A2631_04620 [Candidatus Daviesbacteria bacterium RIFCSPHIGHO2_01_FULL_44_29]|uniref:Aspartate kinase n=1 Tax=Candidatus Daviesbacteria bacterium RIFCSPHIGHO2_02_FULL_43_12 TaxID=1797776 RepID=A0A1F5KGN9_9BACT|nr:MAG: hypothetical protein A2631_04620 [Candidatus Daviesbacteria bacterium RIFCSPHIGHO2_01_FULL_44_29]OGE40004.1 MAG: hypothetical protein A3D25_04350 [Candidatus Daviesbacteria bacterium RIFCSPHIGHO2_02_FULL_43_12]OGE41512.1 MAG: hypothetical protein A3E86_05460 [Candidatus Daviesbacteria bacterium RIFCSPHIGHO2_12_FULL_47_45]OGE70315.1 MAG: hypothetical protein A3B55_01220 [Candidatus Daviesbacteria bacterium RIFCSPLOWO2_01_FULL_43_15]
MIKAADAVLQLLKNDEIALESFRESILNLSAYATKIQKSVEKLTYKPVKKGTIVVALSRLSKSDLKASQKPEIKINHLSTRSPVISYTYQKTFDTQRRVSTLNPYLVTPTDLFGIIEGESEIIIIVSEKAVDLVKDHIGVIPKREVANLVGLTVQFSDKIPSQKVLQSLLSLLSTHQVNIENILPGMNEISFIIAQNSLEQAISALNLYTIKKESAGG